MSEDGFHETLEKSSSAKKTLNGPVYFLIREQAKSVVAIKDLQARLTVLEDLQERLMQAVENVQHHLTSNKTVDGDSQDESRYATAISSYSKLSGNSSASEVESKQDLLNLESSAKADSKGGSINKDSGVISDYKGSVESSYVPYSSTEKFDAEQNDELLKLLDIIDQKSLILLQQVEDGIKPAEIDCEKSVPTSHTNSYVENVITQRQLCEVKADRDDLKQRLVKLEIATDAVVKEKKKLQKKLETIATENHDLQTKIQSAENVNYTNAQFGENYPTSMAEMQKASVRQKYMQYSEKSRKKVANVLKETQVLELQRQLLTYIMENDVLQAKLEQSQPSNWLTWLKVESRLKKQLHNANKDKMLLENALRDRQNEVMALQSKIKELEESLEQSDTVENFGLKSTDDWRQPAGNQKGNFADLSPLNFGDFSKTQSLPATVRLDAQGCPQAFYEHNFNANFRDVSLNSTNSEEKEYFCNDNNKNLLDLTDSNESENSTRSRMLHLRYWNQPAISAEWSTTGSLGCTLHQSNRMRHQNLIQQNSLTKDNSKLINERCYRKDMNTGVNDLDSICTEFDPLNSVPSCENFVDSLNLSIPIKPTQIVSQLSSVGDSLHSASLDLGCASSSMWVRESDKLASTNSVDGIRKILANTSIQSIYKNRISQNQNYSSTPIKSTRALNKHSGIYTK